MAFKSYKKRIKRVKLTLEQAYELTGALSAPFWSSALPQLLKRMRLGKEINDRLWAARKKVHSCVMDVIDAPTRTTMEDAVASWVALEHACWTCFEVPAERRGKKLVPFVWDVGY